MSFTEFARGIAGSFADAEPLATPALSVFELAEKVKR